MKRYTTLEEQLKNFNKGIYIDYRGEEDECYNFYNWNCSDSSLGSHAKKLYGFVKRWVKKADIDVKTCYVRFNNLYDMVYSPYNEFILYNIEDNKILWILKFKSGLIEVIKGPNFNLIAEVKTMDDLVKLKIK